MSHRRLPHVVIVVLSGFVFTGCGRSPEQAAKDAASVRAPEKKPSPVEQARARFEQKHYGQVIPALGADRSAEALEVLVGMLALDAQQIIHRFAAVEKLEQWPDSPERIVAALAGVLERAFWAKEVEAIARVFAKWGQPEQAVLFARYFAGQQDFGLMKGAAEGMKSLLSSQTIPIVLECIPPQPATDRDRRTAERTRLALELCGRVPVPAGIAKFTAHLKANSTHISGPAAIALGRTGTDAAIATLEKLADDRRNPSLAGMAAAGLWHAPQPRARARLASALAGSDRAVAMSAAAALVATATPADTGHFARGLALAQPHLRQRLLGGIGALGPAARPVLTSAATAALSAGRPRTAAMIAETIGDEQIGARAAQALAALVAQNPPSADPGRWLGRKKEEIDPEVPGLQAGQESKSSISGDTLFTSYGPHFLRNADDTLRFYRGQAQTVVRVLVQKNYGASVGGVRLGDAADRVWEKLGPVEEKTLNQMEYELASGERRARYMYHLDRQDRVVAIDVREAADRR